MSIASMSLRARWLHALKVGSWPKLLVPMILGQALGVWVAGRLDWRGLVCGALFTVCDLVFIVLMNDWGDQEVDRIKREMFPDGCSPKTIPDGILPARALFIVGWCAGVLGVVVSWVAQFWLHIPGVGWAGSAALAVFVAYTLPPIRANYRGGGELLEMLGVGCILPCLNMWMQAGTLSFSSTWPALVAFSCISLSSALASGLADEESDRAGGKTTCVVLFGNAPVRSALEKVLLLGGLLWGLGGFVAYTAGAWGQVSASILACLVTLWFAHKTRAMSTHASTNAFAGQRRYKGVLHNAIWYSATGYAAVLIAASLLYSEVSV